MHNVLLLAKIRQLIVQKFKSYLLQLTNYTMKVNKNANSKNKNEPAIFLFVILVALSLVP